MVERFFGSLKHDWLLKVPQLTREHMGKDVPVYMRYYNLDRLHTSNNDMWPINYEKKEKSPLEKCSEKVAQNNDRCITCQHRYSLS